MNNLRTIGLALIAGAFIATPALATYKCTNHTDIGATHYLYSGNNSRTGTSGSLSDLGSASPYTVKDADHLWHELTKYSRRDKEWSATDDFDDGFGAWIVGHGHDDGVADGHGSGVAEYLAGCR